MTQTPSRRGNEKERGRLDLLSAVRRRSERALESGALVPLVTQRHVVVDRGVPFLVHVLDSAARRERGSRATDGPQSNPFLPYEEGLFVADLSPTHVALLNKFNVLDHHLLIVTRAYEEQETLLEEADFTAVARCLEDIDGLAFYNSGVAAGASQSHRHFQIVPRTAPGGTDPFPLLSRLDATSPSAGHAATGHLPCRHRLVVLGAEVLLRRPEEVSRVYRRLVSELGLLGAGETRLAPYNLLATRRLLLVVPRSGERWGEVSVNALGFAGSLLVASRKALADVRRAGPFQILRAVAT